MTITTGTQPKALWPGVAKIFGQTYPMGDIGMQYQQAFEIMKSSKHREEMVEESSFGLAKAKLEGEPIEYDDEYAGPTTTVYMTPYALGYQITREAMDDNQYPQLMQSRTKNLANSMRETKEVVSADLYNRAFSNTRTYGDGVSLINTAHSSVGYTFSNQQATNAQFSEAALESLLIQIRRTKDNRGKLISLRGQKLIVPPNLQFQVDRLLNSTGRIFDGTTTYRNDENAIKSMGMIPEGYFVYDYLTSPTAWFLTTNVGKPLFVDRIPTELDPTDNDFETYNLKAKSYMRFGTTNEDARKIFGSAGA